jgi:hypothetical protein
MGKPTRKQMGGQLTNTENQEVIYRDKTKEYFADMRRYCNDESPTWTTHLQQAKALMPDAAERRVEWLKKTYPNETWTVLQITISFKK